MDLNECLPHQLQYSFSCFLSSLVPYAMGKEGQFQHLNGARSLVAFWIVCAHYMPKGTATGDFLNGAVFRVNVAVCFFVVVSGFVTHWTSEGRPLESVNELLHFYVRRLSRVLVTFWLAMLWAVYLQHKNGQELQVRMVDLFVIGANALDTRGRTIFYGTHRLCEGMLLSNLCVWSFWSIG